MSSIGNIGNFSASSSQGSNDPDKSSNKSRKSSLSSNASSVGSSSSRGAVNSDTSSLKERLSNISSDALASGKSLKDSLTKKAHVLQKGFSRVGGAIANMGRKVLSRGNLGASSSLASGVTSSSIPVAFPKGMEEKYQAIANRDRWYGMKAKNRPSGAALVPGRPQPAPRVKSSSSGLDKSQLKSLTTLPFGEKPIPAPRVFSGGKPIPAPRVFSGGKPAPAPRVFSGGKPAPAPRVFPGRKPVPAPRRQKNEAS
ncbi:hypothetical protein CLAVI_000413 [Candidatus Clavichlamydia salmonicola]|uniref:hypothetical protein n=1 Tax=Candidatus Clavichlamydia salmonicola TaxID=469812 RepID=UPI001890BAA4|nr:hypothetical protein [Candidatus Clavichlamydia salmonicola]MBF5050794.1 hypothetical protein [Candidatus Clavichlamydia salmonicola]